MAIVAPEIPRNIAASQTGLEVAPAVTELPWGIKLPDGLTVGITRDPDQPEWQNAYLVNVIWKVEGRREPRVTVKAYPTTREVNKGGYNSIVVTDVVRPQHWGEDVRDSDEQASEFEIGLAGGLYALIDPKEANVLGRYDRRVPTKISFNQLHGPAATALARLKTPDSIERQPNSDSERTVFLIDRELRGLGELGIKVRPAAPERLVAPPPAHSMPRWG